MKPNKTHTATGLELSNMFISDDGTLTVYLKDKECEVVGGMSTPFGDGMIAIEK